MASEDSHCRHATCCQCGAVRGAPEWTIDCIDAWAMRELAKHNEGRTPPRKLTRKVTP